MPRPNLLYTPARCRATKVDSGVALLDEARLVRADAAPHDEARAGGGATARGFAIEAPATILGMRYEMTGSRGSRSRTLESVKQACVRVVSPDDRGTGYLVADGSIVTCAHVVQNVAARRTVRIEGLAAELRDGLEAELVRVDRHLDVAVLRPRRPICSVEGLSIARSCKAEDKWLSFGFPQQGPQAGMTFRGGVRNPLHRDSRGRLGLELFSRAAAAGMASPLGGLSGSPVVVRGNVVGHHSWTLAGQPRERPNSDTIFAVSGATIADVLSGSASSSTIDEAPRPTLVDLLERQVFRCQSLTEDHIASLAGHPDIALFMARSLNSVGNPKLALEALQHAGNELAVYQQRSLALSRMGQVDEAIDLLERLRDEGHRDGETSGLLGGRYKEKWRRTNDPAWLVKSFEMYDGAFRATKDTYPGINAASLATRLPGETETGRRLAVEIAEILRMKGESRLDHWELATVGEAYLVLGDLGKALLWYRRAVAKAADRWLDRAVMRKQAREVMQAVFGRVEALDQIPEVPRPVAFCGVSADEPGGATPLLPSSKLSAARDWIRRTLQRYRVGFASTSATRGTEMLFLEELFACDGRALVFLPVLVDSFRTRYLGGDWNRRFDRIMEHNKLQGVHSLGSTDTAIDERSALDACQRAIRDHAVQKAKDYDHEPLLICISAVRSPGGRSDHVTEAIRDWRQYGYPVETVDIGDL